MTELERIAIRLAGNIKGWVPWDFRSIHNGVLCTGAVCPLITRGKRKGQPNYRRHDKATLLTVLVPFKKPPRAAARPPGRLNDNPRPQGALQPLDRPARTA